MFGVFWRFRDVLRPYRLSLAGGALLVLLVAATDIATPWPLKVIVDHVLRGEPLGSGFEGLFGPWAGDPDLILAGAVIALLAITGIGALANYLSTSTLDGIGERVMAELRARIFSHLQRLSLTYHDRQRVGDLTSRITGDVNHVQDMLIASLSVLAPNLTVLLGIVVVMFVADPTFTFVAIAVAPVLFVSTYVFTRRIKRAAKVARRMDGEVASVATETLSSIRVVQAYTGEPRHSRLFQDRITDRLAAGLRVVGLQAKFSPIVDMIAAVGTALVMWVGARRVLAGEMSLGLLLVFLTYISQLYRPMRHLSKLATVVSRGQASADRVLEILASDVRVEERADAITAPRFKGEIEFGRVSFGYEAGRPVICDLSLRARPGEVIAIAGHTGAGKSTLVSMVPRFFDPWSGEVRIDGHDVRTFTLASLRRQISLVLQDSILFHGSIYDNIAYGTEQPSRDAVLAAAEAAYVDEFAATMPDGYDTVVSERGATLSGGQRQRIAIARAIVRDAPIVILDEPTSNLDSLSERRVMEGLQSLMTGRTVLIIAHRMSTLHLADRVYLLDRGRIVDAGTHDDMRAESTLYREMYAAQTQTN
jgi:ATP-binding cassette, subfamily B, bacterial